MPVPAATRPSSYAWESATSPAPLTQSRSAVEYSCSSWTRWGSGRFMTTCESSQPYPVFGFGRLGGIPGDHGPGIVGTLCPTLHDLVRDLLRGTRRNDLGRESVTNSIAGEHERVAGVNAQRPRLQPRNRIADRATARWHGLR